MPSRHPTETLLVVAHPLHTTTVYATPMDAAAHLHTCSQTRDHTFSSHYYCLNPIHTRVLARPVQYQADANLNI